mgnify:CR=1 FL=1
MVQVILIRPGATDYDQQGRIQGTLDVPLNDQGSAEVARMIEDLRGRGLEVVYCSPHQSAQQTGETIAKALGIRCKRVEGLRNVDQGLWQGKLVDEVRRKQPRVYRQWQEQPETVCPPGGEMLTEAQNRVAIELSRLLKRHKEGVIGLIVPEPLATVVRHWALQGEWGDLWKVIGDHGRWETVEVEPKTVAQTS